MSSDVDGYHVCTSQGETSLNYNLERSISTAVKTESVCSRSWSDNAVGAYGLHVCMELATPPATFARMLYFSPV